MDENKKEMNILEAITSFDFSILDWIQANLGCPVLDFVMPMLSMLGEFGALWIVLGLIFLLFRKTRRMGVLMLISMAVTFVIGDCGIKNLVQRIRPCNVREYISIPVSRPHSYSFPSGHSAQAFSAGMMIFLHHKGWGIATLVLAVGIAFSRLYNYVHFPTDVLAGALLGILMAILVYYIAKKIRPANQIEARRGGKHFA